MYPIVALAEAADAATRLDAYSRALGYARQWMIKVQQGIDVGTFDDEDIKFVGAIDAASSVFTPNVDGPNPQRKGERNNMGDVWIVATYTPPGATAPLKGRSHLLVTAPLYMKFDPTVTP